MQLPVAVVCWEAAGPSGKIFYCTFLTTRTPEKLEEFQLGKRHGQLYTFSMPVSQDTAYWNAKEAFLGKQLIRFLRQLYPLHYYGSAVQLKITNNMLRITGLTKAIEQEYILTLIQDALWAAYDCGFCYRLQMPAEPFLWGEFDDELLSGQARGSG